MAKMSRVDAILNITPDELMQMSRKDMAKNISILASAGNKRIVRLEKSGVDSPALEYVKFHGGKFSVTGKTKNQLLTEYIRLQQFFGSKTSSVRGAKQWQKNVQNAVGDALKKALPEMSKKNINEQIKQVFSNPETKEKFWDLYSRITSNYDVAEKYQEVWTDIVGALTTQNNNSTDDVFNYLVEQFEKKYQETAPQDSGEELYL